MKTFIVSLVTLAILIVCVTLNCIFVQRSVDDLSRAVEALPDDAATAVLDELSGKWDKCKTWISVSVSHRETDDIDDSISQLEVHIKEKNQSAYASAVASLKCQLSRLAESETLSPGRIF